MKVVILPVLYIIISLCSAIISSFRYVMCFTFVLLWSFKLKPYSYFIKGELWEYLDVEWKGDKKYITTNYAYKYVDRHPIDTFFREFWYFNYFLPSKLYDANELKKEPPKCVTVYKK